MLTRIKNMLLWGRFGNMPREEIIKFLTSVKTWDPGLMRYGTQTLKVVAYSYDKNK